MNNRLDFFEIRGLVINVFLEHRGLDQVIDVALLSDEDIMEVCASTLHLLPHLQAVRDMAASYKDGWAALEIQMPPWFKALQKTSAVSSTIS